MTFCINEKHIWTKKNGKFIHLLSWEIASLSYGEGKDGIIFIKSIDQMRELRELLDRYIQKRKKIKL